MTISEALKSINNYPIQDSTVEMICTIRELDSTSDFTTSVYTSEEYQLAKADVYKYLYSVPNISEQGISFSIQERDDFLSIANSIYLKYGEDENVTGGGTYGEKGEEW